jgi:hypothetical protein
MMLGGHDEVLGKPATGSRGASPVPSTTNQCEGDPNR